MVDSIEGRTIRITTQALNGGSPALEFYAVAEPDPVKAEAIIRVALAIAPDHLVEAVGSLSAEQIAALGLNPGKFAQL